MRKILFILMVLLCGAMCNVAAQDMRMLFLNAPDEVFPLLTKNNRADCVDYVDAGMKAIVTNRLGGVSSLEALTGDYLYVQSSSSSWIEARLLPFNKDSIICVVKGVSAEAADSRLLFYDRMWNRLDDEAMFEQPAIVDFFVQEDSAACYAEKCDIYLVKYSLSKDECMLKAEYTMPSYMSDDDARTISKLLRPIVYRWNGKRFIKE